MRCPWCQDPENRSKVVDSRESGGGVTIRRRRECLSCGKRYTTYERVEEAPLRVIKKDGRREPFSRDKIRACVEISCRKLEVSGDEIEGLVAQVEAAVLALGEPEVGSSFIGAQIMERLRGLNKVAYVRYASLYRVFREPEDFLDELRPLLGD